MLDEGILKYTPLTRNWTTAARSQSDFSFIEVIQSDICEPNTDSNE